MTTLTIDTVAALATGGGLTWGVDRMLQWLRARSDTDAKIEEHRDGLMFELLKAAREEMVQFRSEAAQLRPLLLHAAHLEEALDHLHALLHAEGDAEQRAASRRAKAFLKRMRPEPGERRNALQTEISAARVVRDAHDGTAD